MSTDDDILKDPAAMAFMERVAKAKDQMLRDTLLDLMSPYVFTVVVLDGIRLVNERWQNEKGEPCWSVDGARVDGATLIFAEGAP
jgi:hypothetical protein